MTKAVFITVDGANGPLGGVYAAYRLLVIQIKMANPKAVGTNIPDINGGGSNPELIDASGNTFPVDVQMEYGAPIVAGIPIAGAAPPGPLAHGQSVLEGILFMVPARDTTLELQLTFNYGDTGVWAVP